jgi:beta-N-acetylhexosaminidase
MVEKLGYRLMAAFEGMEPPDRIERWLRERPLAGFTLFRPYNVQHPAQVRELTAQLQRMAAKAGRPHLLIAADQEGGQLIALGAETTQFPGNMALGATGDPALAQAVGYATGREMAALGVNINYAPICDLNTNPSNPSLGIRAFSDDAQLTAEMATAFVTGLQEAGIAATIKHFPGKGDAKVDSHYTMPLIDHSRERLTDKELRPFQAAIDAGAKLVMTGHFAIPSVNNRDDLPATLSRAVMHNLVREEMGFQGVVITDALDMGAISQGAGQVVDVIAALRAGVDLLLLKADPEVQERIYGGIQLAYSRNLLREKHLRESHERIMALKTWTGRMDQPDLSVVSSAHHQQLAEQVAANALTLVRDDAGLLPLHLDKSARIAAIMPQPIDLTPADTSSYITPGLADTLRQHHPWVDEHIVSHTPTPNEIAALRQKASDYDLLIIGTISASMNEHQAALVSELLVVGVSAVTISLRTPYDLLAYPQANTHICTYSILPKSMHALAAALFGKIPFHGRLPVQIPGLYPLGHGLVAKDTKI